VLNGMGDSRCHECLVSGSYPELQGRLQRRRPFTPQDRHAVQLFMVQWAVDPARVLVAHARNGIGVSLLAVYERDFSASPGLNICAGSDDRGAATAVWS